MKDQDWKDLEKATGVDFSSHDSSKLYDLTSEQIEALMTNAQDVWVKLDDKQREYLESIMKSADTIEDAQEALQEKLTGITFEDMEANFIDALADMSMSAGDFVSDFKDTMRTAIIQNMMGDKVTKFTKDYLTRYRAAMEKGYLTSGETEAFKTELETIAEQYKTQANDIANSVGLGGTSSDDSQSKGFATASEDSVEELSGRMLASNEALYSIRDAVANIPAALTQVVTIEAGRNEWYTESLEIQQTSVSHLAAIERNTNELYGMHEKLDKIERNTRNI